MRHHDAEAELVIEVIEAVVVGDSIACLVDEMAADIPKFLKCDNTAAVSIASCATGAWRTRHLKARAAHLRWRALKYQPGRELNADIRTKALPVARLNDLRQRMGMSWQPDSVDEIHAEVSPGEGSENRSSTFCPARSPWCHG